MTTPTETSVAEIERAYDMRLAHARSMHQMAVTAADSRLQCEIEKAAEVREAELNDLRDGQYTPPMIGVGVTRLAELPASDRRTTIGD